MRIKRGAKEVVETLELARTLTVEPSGETVKDEQAGDDQEEPLLDAMGP